MKEMKFDNVILPASPPSLSVDLPGVIVYVSGKDINKINCVEIYFTESEDE